MHYAGVLSNKITHYQASGRNALAHCGEIEDITAVSFLAGW